MNQLSHGERINFPTSVVRSVSFEKVRQGSLSSRTSKPQQIPQKPQQQSGLCQRLLSKKLLTSQSNKISHRALQQRLLPPNEKVAILKKQLQEKQMKECTFKPKVNKSHYPHRTVEEFVDQQMVYQKYKEDKLHQMRQLIKARIDKENTFQPNVSQNRGEGKLEKKGNAVHERLYEEHLKRRQTYDNIVQSNQKRPPSKPTSTRKLTTFSRKNSQKSIVQSGLVSKRHLITSSNIDPSEFNSNVPFVTQHSKNLTNGNQVEGNLTARRQISRASSRQSSRSHKGLKITKHMDVQQLCQKKNPQPQLPQNPKNKQLYIKKILRELTQILSQIYHPQPQPSCSPSPQNEHSSPNLNLNYLQMSLILQKMNFLDKNTNINDRKYSYQIWQMLQGDLYEYCPLGNFVRILFCLLGCHDFGVVEECLAGFLPEVCNQRQLVITQKQSKQIKSNFEQLALNRLRKGQYTAPPTSQLPFNFKPHISKTSSEMAQKYRQRILQQSQQLLNKNLIQYNIKDNGQINHIDLLLLDQKCKEIKLKNKRQQFQKEKLRLEDQAMIGGKRRGRMEDGRDRGDGLQYQSRFNQLYQLGKNNIRNKKQKMYQENIIPKQCTFQPNISKSHTNSHEHSQPFNNSIQSRNQQIPNFQKQIFRMYEGRRIRQQSNNHQSSQTHPNKTHNSSLQSQYHTKSRTQAQDTPFLYLNVCMQGADDIRVPVFHNDNMKTITYKVKVLMGIQEGEGDDMKLEEILKMQIQPMLMEIGGGTSEIRR